MFVELLVNIELGNRMDVLYWEKLMVSWEISWKLSEFIYLIEFVEKEMVLILDVIMYVINYCVKF